MQRLLVYLLTGRDGGTDVETGPLLEDASLTESVTASQVKIQRKRRFGCCITIPIALAAMVHE